VVVQATDLAIFRSRCIQAFYSSQAKLLPAIQTVFIFAARIEAFTWAGLLIGMLLKYTLEITDSGVWLFGRLHGAAFLCYFAAAIFTAHRLRWPFWASLLAILAAIPPLVTYPLEIWFARRGLLQPRANQESRNNPAEAMDE
jgi:integral membrane protein